MKFKNTGAAKSTITRDVNEFIDKTDNIFRAVSIMAKRSTQVNEKMKKELLEKFRKIDNDKSNPSIRKFFQKAKSFWNN